MYVYHLDEIREHIPAQFHKEPPTTGKRVELNGKAWRIDEERDMSDGTTHLICIREH